MAKLKLDWSHWLYGLVGGIIGGGSSSIVASLTTMGLTPDKYDLNINLNRTLKLFFICFVINGMISMFLYLKQKPLPDLETEVEEKTTLIKEPTKTTEIVEKITTTTVPQNEAKPK